MQMRRDCGAECSLRGCHLVSMCWRWTGQNPVILGHTTAWWKNGWVTQMEPGIDFPGTLQVSRRFWSDSQVSKWSAKCSFILIAEGPVGWWLNQSPSPHFPLPHSLLKASRTTCSSNFICRSRVHMVVHGVTLCHNPICYARRQEPYCLLSCMQKCSKG